MKNTDGELSKALLHITRVRLIHIRTTTRTNSHLVRLGKFFVDVFLVLGVDHSDNTVATEGVDLGVFKFAGRYPALEQYVQFSVCTALGLRQTEENPDHTEKTSATPE